MKRPYISISGTLDELILMEAILSFYYENSDSVNDHYLDESDPIGFNEFGSWLLCYEDGWMMYANHKGGDANNENQFKASQIHEILKYIEEYEKN